MFVVAHLTERNCRCGRLVELAVMICPLNHLPKQAHADYSFADKSWSQRRSVQGNRTHNESGHGWQSFKS